MLFILTWILGIFSFVLGGLTWIAKQHGSVHYCKKQGECGLCRDVMHVMRLAFTILFPMLVVSFDDASFILAALSQYISPSADACSVRQLPQLDAASVMNFACVDGFIAVDLQIGIPAWGGASPERAGHMLSQSMATVHRSVPGYSPVSDRRPMYDSRRLKMASLMHGGTRHTPVHRSTHGLHIIPSALLPGLHRPQRNGPGEADGDQWTSPDHPTQSAKPQSPAVVAAEARAFNSHTLGKSKGNRFGFVAPIYESLESFEEGDGPVAWAVKAGSPVKRSLCRNDVRVHMTCGMFALRLQDKWRHLPGPPEWFGRRWGFNISHFSEEQMLVARNAVISRFPALNLSSNAKPTFVVAEDAQQYFGRSFCSLWVAATLMTLGFMDRVVDLFSTSSRQGQNVEEDSEIDDISDSKSWNMTGADDPSLPQSSPCMLLDAHEFWVDALRPSPREGDNCIFPKCSHVRAAVL